MRFAPFDTNAQNLNSSCIFFPLNQLELLSESNRSFSGLNVIFKRRLDSLASLVLQVINSFFFLRMNQTVDSAGPKGVAIPLKGLFWFVRLCAGVSMGLVIIKHFKCGCVMSRGVEVQILSCK